MTRIALTHTPDALAHYYGQKALGELAKLAELRLHQGTTALDTSALVEHARDCQLIVCDRATAAETDVFESLPELVAFLRCAVDIRTIDVQAASARGVLVTRATPGFVDAVTELVVGVMVDLARGITGAAMAYRRGRVPRARMGIQLAGSMLGVVGYGSIGTRLAEVGRELGMSVAVHDPNIEHAAQGVTRVDLDTLLSQSDFVVCLAVASESTENLFDAEAFARMKPGAFFINPSRGNLVDERALHAVLSSGAIAGAALDVGRAPDQMPSPHLAGLHNVIATPHIGGLTQAAVEHQAMDTVRQVRSLLEGRLPEGAVNAERATRWKSLGRCG